MLSWLSFLPVLWLFHSSLNRWWLRPTADILPLAWNGEFFVPLPWDGKFSPSCPHHSLLGDHQDEKQDCPLWHLSQTETTSWRTSSSSSLLKYKTTLLFCKEANKLNLYEDGIKWFSIPFEYLENVKNSWRTSSSSSSSPSSSLLNYKTTLLWLQPFANRQTS